MSMHLTKRSKILVAIVGVVAILGVIAQATGVLAAWNDKVWGNSSFTRAANLEGYARSTTAHAYTNRAITSGEFTATNATHTHVNPGSTLIPSATGWTHASSTGILLLGTVAADGRSSATYTMNGSVVTATAASNAKNIELFPTGFASVLNTDNSQYSASVSCSSSNWGGTVSTNAVVPAGGNFRVGLTNFYAVPAANQTTTIDSLAVGFRVQGTLKSVVTTTAKHALSTLILDVDIKTAITLTTVWTVTVQFVRAECGIGEPLPSAGVQSAAARMARLAPSSSSTAPSESAVSSSAETSEPSPDSESASSGSESSSAADSESKGSSSTTSASESAGAPVLKEGPTTPTDVDVGSRFPVIATDGTDLGTATFQKIESTAPSDGARATIAVKMTVTTSDAEGDGRLSSIAWDDFAPLVGGVQQAAGQAAAEGPPLPAQLEPGETYTGWVAFTVPSAAGSAIWKVSGTSGFTFVLPEPTVPVTSTTSQPAPVAEAPETGAPETSEPTADAPEADASEPEDSDPVPTPEKTSSGSGFEDSADSSDAE
ncbi:hypothetical protein NWF34_01990 [Gordonia sp. GONU]|uniref:hypothetical protein n=1 Tax=Gordonia sp. GONU TaxID=2972949 RepID=UPI0021ACA7CD|nr:hypothetical protein [Gordonia sp. GONU]MCR8895718.1 hypothetical protein [Gordonia sp. GONU]